MINPGYTRVCLFVAWLIALIATVTSLYASEILRLPVCHLCWYQRICTYPLAIVLGVAVYTHNRSVINAVIALPVIGAIIAGYQYVLQMFPDINHIGMCTLDAPCDAIHVQWLGFITLPFMSLLASVALFGLLWIARGKTN